MITDYKRYFEDIPSCPSCGKQLSVCEAPPMHVGDGLGWGSEILYICLNDECPVFVNGWKQIEEQFGHSSSYRHMQLPGSTESNVMMVGSEDAFKGSIVDLEVVEAQNVRYQKEKEAVAFYEEASREEPYSAAKKTFEDFAGEEKKHQALLEGFRKGEKAVSDYKFQWIPDIKRSNYLVDLEFRKGLPYPDILRLAMKREEKALQLYNDLQGKTDDADFVKLFKVLAQEEAKHKHALETLYDDAMAEMGD